MKNKRRKLRPSLNYAQAVYNEICWNCKNRNNCGNCKKAKIVLAEYKKTKYDKIVFQKKKELKEYKYNFKGKEDIYEG